MSLLTVGDGMVWFIKLNRSNFTSTMNGKMKIVILILFCSSLYGHDIEDDYIKWKGYSRLGIIQANNSKTGAGTYFRLKRHTKNTFKDLRLFAHLVSKNDTYLKLRYKNSQKFIKFSQFYNFTVISFDQNKKVGLDIRSQGGQGVGYFLIDYDYGHINTELSFSYDIMDHLNETKKTSYIKIGSFWDNNFPIFETKLEFEAVYQISDIVDNNDLSRFEILFEFYLPLTNHINLIAGYEMEDYFKQDSGYSYFLSVGYKSPLKWTL